MTDKIEWGGTPGPWGVEEPPFDHDYKTHVTIPNALGRPGQTIMVADHNWNEAGARERRISWKEAEMNARAAKEIPAMVEELRKFAAIPYAAFQFHHQQQRVRAILARIDNQEGKN